MGGGRAYPRGRGCGHCPVLHHAGQGLADHLLPLGLREEGALPAGGAGPPLPRQRAPADRTTWLQTPPPPG